jgi:hypothetical protein
MSFALSKSCTETMKSSMSKTAILYCCNGRMPPKSERERGQCSVVCPGGLSTVSARIGSWRHFQCSTYASRWCINICAALRCLSPRIPSNALARFLWQRVSRSKEYIHVPRELRQQAKSMLGSDATTSGPHVQSLQHDQGTRLRAGEISGSIICGA